MTDTTIDVRSVGAVRVITLNRPDKRNALNAAMAEQLHQEWRRFQHSSDRVAVLRAEGPVFTAGLDIRDPPAHFWQAVPDLAFALGKPVIAAVNGPVIAAGVSMVAFCDLCVASHTSSFVYPEAGLGMAAGLISSLIPRIPHKVAMELMLMGTPLSAQRAYEAGFVNQVCAPGEETAAAMAMAQRLTSAAPLVLRFLKQTAREALARGPVEAMYATHYAAQQLAQSADAAEGALAMKEKRPPVFTGV
ncbi:enoyl-CoA hydratase/isomerase family protein [Polaromonas sp. SM01]|uniref:enoyl-CoA hydratase/isomerase family protein n=1 Tax=Polaromonas sp. SM01 TaxID=3085630 RepID=UPI002981319C|nr:enoyl-CoA hydratase/isomerase family protein [Polaromonas sp. SM01]MDW5444900.1 enoyl-CoA hydratase/isomerase family protein [Polaromonas sp. SM01]